MIRKKAIVGFVVFGDSD